MEAFWDWVRGLGPEAAVVLLGALPVIEVRGAIPVGMLMGLLPWTAWALAVLGSALPVPVLLWLGRPVARALKDLPGLRGLVGRGRGWLAGRAQGTQRMLERWGLVGLALFVAVPLPGTGAWTGALAAVLLGLRPWPALLAVVGGSALAGVAVTALTWLGLWSFHKWF